MIETFLIYFFEPFMMIGAGLGIIGLRLSIGKMILISSISGLLTFGVRTFYTMNDIPLGTHTFIVVIYFVLLLKIIGKQRTLDALIATLLSIFLLLVGEGVVLMSLVRLFNIDIINLMNKPGMTMFFALLSYIPIMLIFIVGYIFNISIIEIESFNKTIEL